MPYARNPRVNAGAVDKVAASLAEFGWKQPVVVDAQGIVIVGHTRLLAAKKIGLAEVPVVVASDLTPTQCKAYRLADNRTNEEATWDNALLALELEDLKLDEFDLALTGFDAAELDKLNELSETPGTAREDEDAAPALAAEALSRPGDLWSLGKHRVLCGDCRNFSTVEQLFAGKKANLVITSPPYASQRTYDESSGFKPIAPEDYAAWYRDVAANVMAVLAADGSYFLNIKEHCEDGQRHLYVKDLIIAHVREWAWRWVDEFCWRKTENGVPGTWPNRFKNAWEPVFHFSTHAAVKFHPLANGTESERLIKYDTQKTVIESSTGSGFTRSRESGKREYREGLALPSNVIEARAASTGNHTAPFPVQLPAWFMRAFSDRGDVVYDPFLGSGTTLIAAEKEHRVAYGTEISPLYCDVIVKRWQDFTGKKAVDEDGTRFDERTKEIHA